MTVSLSPVFQDAQLDSQGNPASGHKIFTYAADTSTKIPTFTTLAGDVPHSNPVILNTRGEPPSPIWLTDGAKVDFVFTTPGDTDPPTSPIRTTLMDVSGIGDTQATSQAVSEWIFTGLTPTFLSAVGSTSSFSVNGNQTGTYQVKRRIQAFTSSGAFYGQILTSAFGSGVTNVSGKMDSGALDSSLTRVDVGIVSGQNTSLPVLFQPAIELIEVRSFSTATVVDFVPTAAHVARYKTFRIRIDSGTFTFGSTGVLQARFSVNSGTSYDSGPVDYVAHRFTSPLTSLGTGAAQTSDSLDAGGAAILLTIGPGGFIFGDVEFDLNRGYLFSRIHNFDSINRRISVVHGQKSTQNIQSAIRILLTVGTMTGVFSIFGCI